MTGTKTKAEQLLARAEALAAEIEAQRDVIEAARAGIARAESKRAPIEARKPGPNRLRLACTRLGIRAPNHRAFDVCGALRLSEMGYRGPTAEVRRVRGGHEVRLFPNPPELVPGPLWLAITRLCELCEGVAA